MSWLRKIAQLQSNEDLYYRRGLFPSQRVYAPLKWSSQDDNIFFTSLVIFTLQQLKNQLNKDDQKMVNEITKTACASYPYYRNQQGWNTYNFWQTNPRKHFPNSFIFSRLKHFALPDDADVTSLIYLTQKQNPQDVPWFKDKLATHTNLFAQRIGNTLPQFRGLKAYSTWMGEKMFIEFDFCVLCNLMYFIYCNKLELNEHDADTIVYLSTVIRTDLHLTHPFQISHSYPNSSVIIYHFGRLVSSFQIQHLDEQKDKIIRDIQYIYPRVTFMEKIILNSTLMKLGVNPLSLKFPINIKEEMADFFFFHAGMFTAYENSVARFLAPSDFFHLKFRCEAYYQVLILEYELLKKNF